MIYDLVIGETLSPYHMRSLYQERFETESPIRSFPIALSRITQSIEKVIQQSPEPYDDKIMTVVNQIIIMNNGYLAGASMDTDLDVVKFRSYLEVLGYLGFQVYMVERLDITTVDSPMEDSVRAYLLDINSEVFPTIDRICQGFGQLYDVAINAGIPTVVMNYLMTTIAFDDITNEVLEIPQAISKFTALKDAGAGDMFDVSELLEFLTRYGYRIVISIL